MAVNAIQNYSGINNDDLTSESSTQLYPLGTKITVTDANNVAATYIYVKAHNTLTQYVPYALDHDGTTSYLTAAPATGAQKIVVPQIGGTSGYYLWVLWEGNGSSKAGTETFAAGDYLQVLTTGTTMVVDGTSGSTVELVTSTAICKSAGTAAATINIFLLGHKADIAGS